MKPLREVSDNTKNMKYRNGDRFRPQYDPASSLDNITVVQIKSLQPLGAPAPEQLQLLPYVAVALAQELAQVVH